MAASATSSNAFRINAQSACEIGRDTSLSISGRISACLSVTTGAPSVQTGLRSPGNRTACDRVCCARPAGPTSGHCSPIRCDMSDILGRTRQARCVEQCRAELGRVLEFPVEPRRAKSSRAAPKSAEQRDNSHWSYVVEQDCKADFAALAHARIIVWQT